MARPHNFMDNYGRPDFKLPYRWNDDTPMSLPLAPKSVHATSPYMIGVIDIRWDNPTIYAENNGLQVLGVNIYRAYDSPEAAYTLLNPSPVGALYYRDQTTEVLVPAEDPVAGGRFIAGTNATGDWIIHTYNKPIIIPGTNGEIAQHSKHVVVQIKPTAIDSFQTVPAWRVVGETGEVFLINRKVYNHTTNRIDDPVLPILSQGGEVRIAYTYISGWIQTDINRKIYYKVTTVALDPETSQIIETPMNQVEAVSLYDMERIDYIWAEAIRRNRWILEQGGERVKVFIRKWAGERCTCWDEQYRQGKNDHHLCFAPGTLINTETGWRAIESIDAGDKVLSSDGYYHRVKGTICRPYKGDMLSILSSINTNPIIVTPEHPFLVLRSTHTLYSGHNRKALCGPKCNSFIERGDGNARPPCVRKLPSGRWLARAQIGGSRNEGRVSLGTYSTREEAVEAVNRYKQEHWKPAHRLEWDQAKNIVKRDWLTPQWNSETRDVDTIKVPEEFLKKGGSGPGRKGATEFVVDSEFLWVVGMYIAEGSSSKSRRGKKYKGGGGSIHFSLHKNEKDYQERLISFFRRYGYNPSLTISKKVQSAIVSVHSVTLQEWFPKWLGYLCYNKHIPQELMYLPKDKTWELIRGVYDGDGLKSDHEITQTSEILALQLVELLHRVGEQPLVRRQISNVLTPIGNRRRPAYCVSWAEDNFTHGSRKRRWVFHDRILARVTDVKKIDYKGPVYNLEVEGDPTYIVNGITSHNCYGTGIISGFEGPYDILIAPPETEKTVQLMDMGLHVNYDWNTWTSPYPLLNDRDFVVRQNNDRYSVAHVNPQGARGAIFQQHFMLAPLDQHDIRYQVPINGGLTVPASWNAYREGKPSDASPTIPNKPGVPDQYELRGRTVTFENIVYALPPFIIIGLTALVKSVCLCLGAMS